MCGICGIIHNDPSRHVNPEILNRMNRTMVHRGPDDEGTYIKGPAGLAMRRLSIIDLAGGHQPLANEDGSVQVVLNGEIYNFEELKEDLESRGHIFKTRSDTEVIPHLYEEFGLSFAEKLNGMFGLALWDSKNKRLVLARDRMGKKPLYYTNQKGAFLFGSELKAILAHPDTEKKIDHAALAKYLAYEYIPAPKSIFEGIFKLEPGHILILENGNSSIKRYWDIPTEEFSGVKEADAIHTIKDLLFAAVKRRLISDVPLGVFLSGGIDSSTVTYMMTKIMPPAQVKTFSIAFAEKSFDESSYAKTVANHLGTDHREQVCTPEDLLNLLPEVENFLDEPMGDPSIVPTYALSKFTRQHVTVALGGDGGDELFAGYPTYQAERFSPLYRIMPGFLQRRVFEPLALRLPVSDENVSFDFKVKQFVKGAGMKSPARHFVWMGSFSEPELDEILTDKKYGRVFDDVDRFLNSSANASDGNRLLYLYNKLYLNEDILVKVDRASMGTSLEVRAPFLDYHVVEFVSRLPYKMKLNGLTMKYILKKAMEDLLPSGIAHRPKKGFGLPVAKWIKGPLREMAQELLHPDKIRKEGFFEPEEVSRILDDHLKLRANNAKKLWTLLIFELWLEKWGTKTSA